MDHVSTTTEDQTKEGQVIVVGVCVDLLLSYQRNSVGVI